MYYQTPTYYSYPLSKLSGKNITLKMECYQPTGSFKIRGVGHLCQHYVDQGAQHLVAFSGGNAGLAVAYAGKQLGVKVSVFMPYTSHQRFIDAISLLDAEVNIIQDKYDGVLKAAHEFTETTEHAAFVDPFDHELIWEGHSTMVNEIIADGYSPDAVILSVGGGGLACGVIRGLQKHGANNIPVYCAETEGAASFKAAYDANQVVALDDINTIATSLGAKQVTSQLVKYKLLQPLTPITVTDFAAVNAARKFIDAHNVVVEPSCGASLSCIYNIDQYPELLRHENILIIVCGGVGSDVVQLDEYLSQHGDLTT